MADRQICDLSPRPQNPGSLENAEMELRRAGLPRECNGVSFAARPRSLHRVVSCQLGESDSAYRLFPEFCWIEASPVGLLEVGRNTTGRKREMPDRRGPKGGGTFGKVFRPWVSS
jgi:hypothetical protein